MTRLRSLNNLSQLEQSEFGRPSPRHGLKLLYWFASDLVIFEDYGMTVNCYPEDGDFGFHEFRNRYERNYTRLLPDTNSIYYVVGNLNKTGAEDLPDYIREEYTGLMDNSNTDRIIISQDDTDFLDQVYVTKHSDRYNYDSKSTFCITKDLLKVISNLELENFLYKTGLWVLPMYISPQPIRPVVIINPQPVSHPEPVNPQSNQENFMKAIQASIRRINSFRIQSANSETNQEASTEGQTYVIKRSKSTCSFSVNPSSNKAPGSKMQAPYALRSKSFNISSSVQQFNQEIKLNPLPPARTKSIRIPSADSSGNQDTSIEIEPTPVIIPIPSMIDDDDECSIKGRRKKRCCGCIII